MWVVALVGSLLLLAFTLGAVREPRAVATLAVGQAVAMVGSFCACMVLPPVMVQAGVGLLALPLLATARGVRTYSWVCVGAFVAGWATAGVNAVRDAHEYARLRAEYPFASPADRLEPRPPAVPPAFDATGLRAAEEEYDHLEQSAGSLLGRTGQLRRLHEEHAALFADSAGFGVGRMPNVSPTAARLADPGPPQRWSDRSLQELVRDDALDFADPRRWGYRRGEQVAGFLPHALRRPAGSAGGWTVERVELIGLLLAPDPRVYVSETLPRMDHLADVPTRHPDGFESPALARLRAGDDLVHDVPLGRLLGAIRSARQCLTCHGGERGDLLGAFSYHLRARSP